MNGSKREMMRSARPGPELDVSRAHFSYEIGRRLPWILLSVVAGVAVQGHRALSLGRNGDGGQRRHRTTAISDILSILIYLLVATLILFSA